MASTPAEAEKKLVGLGEALPGTYKSFLTDVVGEESLAGQRTDAGTILDLVDSLAGRITAAYSGGRVATVNFDSVQITCPILHGDMVRMDGQVVRVGSSSMLVEIRVYKWELNTRRYIPVQYCLVTMVALTEDLRPRKGLPMLPDGNDAACAEFVANRKKASLALKIKIKALEAAAAAGELTAADVYDSSIGSDHILESITMDAATMYFRKQFLPRSLNINKTIFGGDLLKWMERAARTTAKAFARNPYVYTIAMSEMTFSVPIFLSDMVELEATPVYVRRHVVVIAVRINVERLDGTVLRSHSGSFTVATLDGSGFRAALPVALDLEAATQKELLAYAKAKETHYHWKNEYEEALLPSNYNDPWPVIEIPNLVLSPRR
ncbi:ATP-binding Cassette superfamily protein [Thecamonas trahens ATCC 50062]|uniref:ATP-binding Cassette superfamily protein n=1 Tax=Thecamonas trahens ATCC 50062 TaxID=461836 RepID=A0A0L0D9G0_THETB|nr:ATP-binding Cassette superfamily protein [Thecamonas trahens ATCC 50062]KNC49007.1 ATP-binding Cassette superfamily protein [Thecamonas trahens ATCC 50062]|eukprot:XP_013758418.1 ATP-binding Cassette superfamily protein [Thecamonas trahens ATCC 50062]